MLKSLPPDPARHQDSAITLKGITKHQNPEARRNRQIEEYRQVARVGV
jgi:hypothetical protein